MSGGEIVRDVDNAAFIAASRELVPQLLTALDAERAKLARLVEALENEVKRSRRHLADSTLAALAQIKGGA
jgi:fumarate hydratase class II